MPFSFHIYPPDIWVNLKLNKSQQVASGKAGKRVYFEGTGIAALTAAARLGKFGYETFVNGRITGNTKIEDFEFDNAPLLTLPAVFRDFFQKTGKHFGQELEVKPTEPAFVFHFPDLKIEFANLSRNERLAEIEQKLGREAAKEWDALLKEADYLWGGLRENYVECEFSYLRANLPTYIRLRTPRLKHPYLQAILGHYATYLGYPAGIYKWSHLVAFVEESFGIWQITGGTGALLKAIEERASLLGTNFEGVTNFDFYIDSTEVHNVPSRRLIGIDKYPGEIPVRSIYFGREQTTDIYATKLANGKYSLVMTGDLTLSDYDQYSVIDQIRGGITGSADNQLLTRIRTSNKNRFKVKHLDTLAHAGICGELLANAVRGIKNRPSHEH